MVRISVLGDALKTMYNAEKRGKRQVLIRPSSKVVIKFLQVMMKKGEAPNTLPAPLCCTCSAAPVKRPPVERLLSFFTFYLLCNQCAYVLPLFSSMWSPFLQKGRPKVLCWGVETFWSGNLMPVLGILSRLCARVHLML
jgi:hypothetical protein